MASTKDNADYEHWPDTNKLSTEPAAHYTSHNGLHEHTYRPASGAKDTKPAPKTPELVAAQQPQFAMPFAYPQGAYMPYTAAPAYYGYGGAPLYPPAYAPVAAEILQPATTKEAEAEKKDSPVASPRKWQGRTKAEVAEDDMKVAAAQGAYAPRKVVPLGLADDQVVWVVEPDGATVLRTFAEVKEAAGEWKTDPRFEESWYFVREAGGEGKK